MHLHIEGLDLAGKSTLCRHLHTALPDAAYYHNAITDNNRLYETADQLRLQDQMPDAKLGELYYGALLGDLRAYVPRKGNSLQDSTILLRSLVFHRFNGNEDLARRLEDLLPEHPRFDHSIVLTSTRDVRLRRLEGRVAHGNDAPDDFVVRDDPARFEAMEQLLIETASRHFQAEVIDTSNMEAEGEKERLVEFVLKKATERMTNRDSDVFGWQRAAKLAAHLHRHQLRRDGETPYIAHPVRVMLTLSQVFNVRDPDLLAAALLHDAIEDTTGDYDDVLEAAGPAVADIVACLSKDPRIRENRREELYHEALANADWRVKLIKMADVYDNFRDSRESNLQKASSTDNVLKMIHIAGEDPRLSNAKRRLEDLIT